MKHKLLFASLLAIICFSALAYLPTALACCPPKTVTVTVYYATSTNTWAIHCKGCHFEGVRRIWTASLTYYCTPPSTIKVDVNRFYNTITTIWGTNQFKTPFSDIKTISEKLYCRTVIDYHAQICGQKWQKPTPIYSWITFTINHKLQITVKGLPTITTILTP